MGVLRFITCGSVDDGKSTLIGRLLYDTKLIFEDQLAALKKDSVKHGTQGENIDFALLLDGLEAEREQGITIDVAYRFFATDKRKFIVADTPGPRTVHAQHGDRRLDRRSRGHPDRCPQGRAAAVQAPHLHRQHAGRPPHRGGRQQDGSRRLQPRPLPRDRRQLSQIAENLGFESITPIPMSALKGENITAKSAACRGIDGPTLMRMLESVELDETTRAGGPLRLPVQWVNRPNLDFRGFAGWLKLGAKTVSAQVTDIKYKVNVNTLEHLAAKVLELNEIAICNVSLDQPIAFEPYATNQDLGGFVLIDRMSNATVAAGLVHFSLRRAQNVHWQALDVTRDTRAEQKTQKPAVLWFTGLSGAGKSTIANLVDKKLTSLGKHTALLDGDNIRHGLNRDLGFTDADRVENIRRVAEVSKLMIDSGLIVLVSFISPFRAEREMARRMMPDGEFFEIFIDTPLEEAERRDVKGLYKKARAGLLKNFTGVDSPYEQPEHPEVHINTMAFDPAAAADAIVAKLLSRS
jgi:adenylyl-sulfate kinase